MKPVSIPSLFRLLSVALYVICLPLEGVCTNGECGIGILYLIFGALGFFLSVTNLAWLANVALFIAWANLTSGITRLGMAGAVLAPILATLPLMMPDIVSNEGGVPTRIDGYGAGYWLWLASTVVMLLGYLWKATTVRTRAEG